MIHAVLASACGIRQSKLHTQHVRPESGMGSSGVDVCLLVKT